MAQRYEPKTAFAHFIHEFEETVIALLLGVMTMITFANVILRPSFPFVDIFNIVLGATVDHQEPLGGLAVPPRTLGAPSTTPT